MKGSNELRAGDFRGAAEKMGCRNIRRSGRRPSEAPDAGALEFFCNKDSYDTTIYPVLKGVKSNPRGLLFEISIVLDDMKVLSWNC